MSQSLQTYDLAQLQQSSAKWRNSAALREVYGNIFTAMRAACVSGKSLEIGAGIGVAREYIPGLVTSDLVATGFVDRTVSAYEIPAEGWSNILAFDVLHHLREPFRFFSSAAAALAPGGRIILVEPAGTPGGRLFYGLFHPEPCRPGEIHPPFVFPADAEGLFANMGMAQALFGRERTAVDLALQEHGLRVRSLVYRDLIAYPATGGFSKPALLPALLLRGLLKLEQGLPQTWLRFMALRMIVVLEKSTPV